MTTYLACLGTRPEIIKMAPLHRELQQRGHRVVVLHTGQHEAVAEVLYRFFGMGPDVRLPPNGAAIGWATSRRCCSKGWIVRSPNPSRTWSWCRVTPRQHWWGH